MIVGIDASRAARAHRTGTENYSLQLIRSLASVGREHHFRLYFNTPPAAGLFRSSPHVELRVIPFPRVWTHVRLSAEMAVAPPDVLFVPAHVLPLIRPRRAVVTVHDAGYHYFPEAHRRRDRLYLEWSTRYHARVASHLLADSQATCDDLSRLYGVEPNRVTVVYPGYHPAFRPIADAATLDVVRARYDLDRDFVLHVGTLQPRKNLDRLLEAMGRLQHEAAGRGEKPPLLLLVGRLGWRAEDLRRRIADPEAQGAVRWLGYVDDADLPAVMNLARALAMPSLYEGFGLPVLEAMACGTPVVCSNTSSLPEVAGDAGLLVDPRDPGEIAAALHRALSDDALRRRMREQGLARARMFSWEAAGRKVMEVLTGETGDVRRET